METEINMTESIPTKNQWRFLVEWSMLNLLGWGIGLFIAYIFYAILESIKPSVLKTMVAWLPFGASIGVLQWVKLRKISVNLYKWSIATALGFSISASLFYWFTNLPSLHDRYNVPYWAINTGFIVTMLIGGVSVGILQSFTIRKYISKPGLWVSAYIFWLLLLFGSMLFIEFQKSFFLNLYYFFGDFLHLISFDFSFELIIGFIIILTTLGISIPTGYILLKHSNIGSVIKNAG
jgi:hypothetical protein